MNDAGVPAIVRNNRENLMEVLKSRCRTSFNRAGLSARRKDRKSTNVGNPGCHKPTIWAWFSQFSLGVTTLTADPDESISIFLGFALVCCRKIRERIRIYPAKRNIRTFGLFNNKYAVLSSQEHGFRGGLSPNNSCFPCLECKQRPYLWAEMFFSHGIFVSYALMYVAHII